MSQYACVSIKQLFQRDHTVDVADIGCIKALSERCSSKLKNTRFKLIFRLCDVTYVIVNIKVMIMIAFPSHCTKMIS